MKRTHRVVLLAAGLYAFLLPAQKPNPATPAPASYYRLKEFKIMDTHGFGQPVEVGRLLIPADWRVEGGVNWDQSQLRCPINIIKIQLRAVAPDGVTGIEMSPSHMWTFASDPTMVQMLRQQAASGMGCDVGPPIGSVDFLRQMVPRSRPGARVTGGELLPDVTQAKQALLAASYGPMVQAGSIRSFKADAGSVRITYAQNGQNMEESMSTTIVSVATPTMNTGALMQGQVSMSATAYSIASEGVFSARFPAGKFDNKLVATIVASTRPNPQYEAAVGQFLANMNNIAQKGAMDRARIWRDAGQQISANIVQSYQHRQSVQDRAAQQFSQTIRGVETYVNPSTGTKVELTGGYDNAWVNNRGEYLVSDSPGFNASVALKENWTQLKKSR